MTFCRLETGSPPTRWVGESGVTQLGVVALDRAQLVEQRVVGVVADLGVVEDVVAVAVVGELLAQLGGALGSHAHSASSSAAGSSSAREVVGAQGLEPVRGGEVEVQRRHRDAAGGDGGEVGALLVVVDRRVAVDAEAPAAVLLLDDLQLVAVDALAEPRHLDAVGVAGRAR